MLKYISESILKLAGWQLDVVQPQEKKYVMIGAPHTTNWDFPLALLTFWTLRQKIHWVGKKEMFWGPLHTLFTFLGGIPVDRSKSTGFIEQIADRFDQAEAMVLAISPEGTRARTDHWKSGFYHIAVSAKVPICLAYVDFSRKTLGFSRVIYPTGNIDEDMEIIADFYQDIQGKRPQNQGPVRLRQ
ncbi:MAG: lysophospholipid acyltransferase family protein [Gammaproteobacteria bacterium]|nr:lysophospholipid acyltransferase family protein [Gammaproteobacteria bacterium]